MTTGTDWPIRVLLALIRGGMPVVGVMYYGWTAQQVAFFFWLELVMFGVFCAVVQSREDWHAPSSLPRKVWVPIVVVGYQIPALVVGVFMTAGIQGPLAKLAYLGTLLGDRTLAIAAGIQLVVAVASAFAWNHRRADADATLDRQARELANRVVATLAIGGITVAAVAIWNLAGDAGDVLANRRQALAVAWVVGITWAASDLFPRLVARFVDLVAGGKRTRDPTVDQR